MTAIRCKLQITIFFFQSYLASTSAANNPTKEFKFKFNLNWSSLTMSNICYFYNRPVGHYDTHHMRNDMDTQFASKASASVSSFDPNFKIHQASFQTYKENNEDRIVVKKTDYGCIIGVFDGTRNNSIFDTPTLLKIPTMVFRSLRL